MRRRLGDFLGGEESEKEEEDEENDRSPLKRSDHLRTKKRLEAMDNAMFGENWQSKAFDQVCMVGPDR
jgi:hypothetical protein